MKMRRRQVLAAPLALAAPFAHAAAPAEAARKVLRLAFNISESGFDPPKFSDLYSRAVNSHIFEALYGYDHLARPSKFKPLLADGWPQTSDDFKVWTVRVRKGVWFSDDPAFKGVRREATAADAGYAFKRIVDPASKSPFSSTVLDIGISGLGALRETALKQRKPFDYDAAIPGIQVLDRYTLRFTLDEPRPRFIEHLAASDSLPLQAREVVEFYGDKIADHPVGTGPFRLVRERWVRSSQIVLERNPQYREVFYDAQPGADDAEGQAVLARLKGRRLPMVDEVHIAVIEENQPRWLSFVNGQIDGLMALTGALPLDYAPIAVPNGKLAPFLKKRGVQAYRSVNPDSGVTYFNMEDPVVGGYTPEKVALRRAISLALDVDREIRLLRRGQAVPAQSPLVPHTSGYDPHFKSEMGDYDPARAKALLDMYGYVDRDGDGWRELPDGSPLVLHRATETQQISRQFDDLWRKNMTAVGIKVEFHIAQWPANMKAALAGKLQIWLLGESADLPDGQGALARLYGPQAGGENLARFKLPAFDRLYERMLALPDGDERNRLFTEAKRIACAYMPYKYHVHRMANDLAHPWVTGFRRPLFWNDWWHMVDIDPARQPPAA
jgi:ABC-type transport system substrate-binding protein